MPALILVRHGQASFGAADYDQLSELGYRQAAITAEELERRRIAPTMLVSGSLKRQRQTAQAIVELASSTSSANSASSAGSVSSAGARLELATDPRWNEYSSEDLLTAHSGSDARLAGATAATMSSRTFQAILDDGLLAWAAAGEETTATESWPAFRARVDAALRATVAGLGSGETGVVVSSAGVIAAACTTLLRGSVDTFIALNRVAVNAAITTITSGASGESLLAFNDHAHFQAIGRELITFR